MQSSVEYMVTIHLLCSVNFVHAEYYKNVQNVVIHSREVRGVPMGVRMGAFILFVGGALWIDWFKLLK